MLKPVYERLLIKVSGESLRGDSSSSFDRGALGLLVSHIESVKDAGCDVALVIGGGNIFRGKENTISEMDRADADAMGMLATIMNGLVLRSLFQSRGLDCRLISGLSVPSLCDTYIRENCLEAFDQGQILIFTGGTGSPFFTTDTAATLRALEMECDVLVKLTKVDGVYDKDPVKFPAAHRFERLTFQEVLVHHYAVMDATAIALAREGNLPVIVGSFFSDDIMSEILRGNGNFTTIQEDERCKNTSMH
jgi:uridylate kinase